MGVAFGSLTVLALGFVCNELLEHRRQLLQDLLLPDSDLDGHLLPPRRSLQRPRGFGLAQSLQKLAVLLDGRGVMRLPLLHRFQEDIGFLQSQDRFGRLILGFQLLQLLRGECQRLDEG